MFSKIKSLFKKTTYKPPDTTKEKIEYIINNIQNIDVYDTELIKNSLQSYFIDVVEYIDLIKTIIEFPINKEYIIIPKIHNKIELRYLDWLTMDGRLLPNVNLTILEFVTLTKSLIETYDIASSSPLIPFLYGNSTKIYPYYINTTDIVDDIYHKLFTN